MFFLIETKIVQKNLYVVEADASFKKEDAIKRVAEGDLRDFSQSYQGEEVSGFKSITMDEYIALFDEIYPGMKEIDKNSKLLQIADINESVIFGGTEKDEL